MGEKFDYAIIDRFKNLYDGGYRCINYEVNEKNNLFTVYLKNFERETTETLECNSEDGIILRNYIDGLS